MPEIKKNIQLHGDETLIVITIMLVFLCIIFLYSNESKKTPVPTTVIVASTTPTIVTPSDNPFLKLALIAPQAIVYDMREEKVLYEKNADRAVPLASLTKIMTAKTVADYLPKDALVSIIKELTADADPQLVQNETLTMKDLLDYTLTISSNDGAVSLAAAASSMSSTINSRADFITAMNRDAETLGLTKTTFFNESGLDENMTRAGAYGSARDMATLFAYMIEHHPDLLEATRYQSFTIPSDTASTHMAVNTNSIVAQIPGLIGSKTGFTDLAGGNLVIAYDASLNHPIIITVLGSTYDGRFTDTQALITATNAYLSLQNR